MSSQTTTSFLAVVATTSTLVAAYWYYKQRKGKSVPLGPPRSGDARYELSLVGDVDRIYDKHGPVPFEFNKEVVQVFDDMVSRSVPLYCEVADLLLYWVHRYYKPNTIIYDLGSSTGTTLDVILKSFKTKVKVVGVDNSEAMVEECQEKLKWANARHDITIHLNDILSLPIENASFVIMNYTLQFVRIEKRHELLERICKGMCDGGIVFISEKVRTEYAEFQEACTWIYEDFKHRRGYSKTYIARKKDALMNVLVPFTEDELKAALIAAGFVHVQIVAKWNNFTTLVGRKSGMARVVGKKKPTEVLTPYLDSLFEACPVYLTDYLNPIQLQNVCLERLKHFSNKGGLGAPTLRSYESIAHKIQTMPVNREEYTLVVNESTLSFGTAEDFSTEDLVATRGLLEDLKPWKKGPLSFFGIQIDTEWRSDWKWERILPHLPPLKEKVICDLGCGNGYFMYRMLEKEPKLVLGIDPNPHAWLEFQLMRRCSPQVSNVHLELLRGEHMELFPNMFDVVFCLGVLYHTPDPVGMLRTIHKSMKRGSCLVVDCQGIPGTDHVALFPKKRYANMGGVYFLPTIETLKLWLSRANFIQQEVIFSQPLSIEEQRITEWAPVNTSLRESLNGTLTETVEGYPAPHRFYIRAKRG